MIAFIFISCNLKPFPVTGMDDGERRFDIWWLIVVSGEKRMLCHRLHAKDFHQRFTVLTYQLQGGIHHHVHTEEYKAE